LHDMPDSPTEPVQASLSIDDRGPVTVNCVRREAEERDALLLSYHDGKPVTGENGKLIYGNEELRIHFVELDEANSAGVWEILREGPK
jgi:hypothetical protein